MQYEPLDLSAFPHEREASLRGISRYSMFEVMYYRPTLWEHAHKVLWIVEELLSAVPSHVRVDPKKARIMAFVHDDAEILTGDIQAGHKARMSAEQLRKLEEDELRAARDLSERYPKEVHGYEYAGLLFEMVHKETPESQLVGLADKLDARCETFHELFGGNFSFVSSTAFYISTLHRLGEKLPLFAAFIRDKAHPLLQDLGPLPSDGKLRPADFAHFNKPHTIESLEAPSRFPFYDAWRKLICDRGGEEGVRWLTERRE